MNSLHRLLFILILSGLLTISGGTLLAKDSSPVMAFGYLHNSEDNSQYEFLENIFPNSFANSLRRVYNVKVKKPYEIQELLKEKDSELKKDYTYAELPELMEDIGADLFVYGSFKLIGANKISITLHLYEKGSNKVFSFNSTGEMETEIFRLVDRITVTMVQLIREEQIYRAQTIPAGSKIGILSPLEGKELNDLYLEFFKEGYTLTSMGAADVSSYLDYNNLAPFLYISTELNSYDYFSNIDDFSWYTGSWATSSYLDQMNQHRAVMKKYDFRYSETKKETIQALQREYGNCDILLIIGTDKKGKKAWVRAIDLKETNLVWTQRNITYKDGADLASQLTEMMKSPVSTTISSLEEKEK